jgi:Permuted papain-like amidase enzyme, YaeF/YiiX, C92 family
VKHMRLFLCFTVSLMLIYSCRGKKDPAQIEQERQAAAKAANKQAVDSIKAQLRDGDLIARAGISWESDQIRDFQVKDKSFTHMGMVKKMNGQWMVCHITGRDSVYYKNDLAHYELLDSFISPLRCSGLGWYRLNMNAQETNNALAYMDGCVQRNLHFDIYFNMANDSAMTCTEMIAKAAKSATGGRISAGFTPVTERRHVNLIKRVYRRFRVKDSDVIGRPIIAVDDITTNKDCREIRRYFYQ